jgi:hypothetical protein
MAYDIGRGLTGAGTGAAYGAAFGPIGSLVGGGLGAIGGFFGSRKEKKPRQVSTFDPRQKQLYEQQSQALQGAGGPLADVYGQYNPQQMQDFYQKAYAQPQYQEFQENIVPTITGQFRGQNLQNSSYLGGALAKAGTNVQNNLNAQMAQLLYNGQQSQLDRRSNAIDRALNLQTHVNQRRQPSVFDNLLTTLSSGAGDMLGDILKNRRTPYQTAQSSGVQPTIGG